MYEKIQKANFKNQNGNIKNKDSVLIESYIIAKTSKLLTETIELLDSPQIQRKILASKENKSTLLLN